MQPTRAPLWIILAAVACQNVSGPTHQYLVATVTANGVGVDPAYLVKIDTASDIPLAPGRSDSVSVEVGEHLVRLDDIASNCAVIGSNPITVRVAADEYIDANFSVTCAGAPPPPPPPPGTTLKITVLTTGPNPPASFGVRVNDGQYYGYNRSVIVPSNGTVGITPPPGTYSVSLSGLSGLCTVSGPSQVSVTIATGTVTTVEFHVVCDLPGIVVVSAPTTGTDLGTGYQVLVDGAVQGAMALGGTDTLLLPAGLHNVGLGGIPANCTVSGANPHTVTVIVGTTTGLSFPVTCQPNPTLRVAVTTTGANAPASYVAGIDPDYYGYAHTLTVSSNGNASIKLSPGSHRVNLLVPLNCTVTTPNNVLVSVPLGTTTNVAFAATCH